MKPSQALILVGGLGSRLGELTRRTPKPMLDIGGRPFVTYLISLLADQGLSRFLLLAGYRSAVVSEYFSALPQTPGLAIEVLDEPAPMGTGGALALARERLDDLFILANGDSLTWADLGGLLRPFKRESSWGRLALRPVDNNIRYGQVRVEGELISGFSPRPEPGPPAPTWMNAGLYCLSRELTEHLPQGPHSLEADVFPRLAAEGRLEYLGLDPEAYFIDIGLPEDLARARKTLPGLKAPNGTMLRRTAIWSELFTREQTSAAASLLPGAPGGRP